MATSTRITRPAPGAAAAAAAAVALPGDVRLMNAVASGVYALVVLALLAAGLLWLSRSPLFAIRSLRVEGDLLRINAETLRASAASRLTGNFFSTDLGRARAAFEAVPWVRRATVRRAWPDRLVVHIEEHRAAALWDGDDRDDRLVNQQGEVFSANVGDVEDEALPTFSGPAGSSAAVLSLYRRLQPLLQTLDLEVEQLQQSSRGSWRALLDNGATLELGRGSEDEVMARSERFVRTLPEMLARYRAPLEYADLRHADGYALRLRGVSTNPAPNAKPGP